MKHKKLIRSLAIFLLAPAFSIGVAQASSTVDKSGPQGNLSQMGAFQMADSSPGNDDIGSDGVKRRGDGSIDDSQPGLRGDDRHKMRSRNRGRGNANDDMSDTTRTDNSGKGRMERLDGDNRGRGRGRGRGGRVDRVERQDSSGRSDRVERPDRSGKGRGRGGRG